MDPEQCARVAGLLRAIEIPAADEDKPLVGVGPGELPNFYLAVVAVCHQTSPVGGVRLEGVTASGERLFGWDYLRARWADRVAADRHWNAPEAWAAMRAEDVTWILRDSAGLDTISDAEGRAALLRDLGVGMSRAGWRDAAAMFGASGHKVEEIYRFLDAFRAYSDPVRKKSCFFLELMRGQCGWRYRDADKLGAPVDYHEVRGHLRLGTVVIADRTLAARMAKGEETTAAEDVAIRGAVYEAIGRIAEMHGGQDPATLHYFFWNVFRRCCGREATHCAECDTTCGLPDRYRRANAPVAVGGCVFSSVCASAGKDGKPREHFHRTEFY